MLAMTVGAVCSISAFAGETEVETEVVTESVQDLGEEGAVLSDDIFDFQMQIDDAVYQFPMTYEEFTANGWELNSDYNEETETLTPHQYDLVYFKKGNAKCMTYVINLGMNTQAITECLVGGIEIDNFDWEEGAGTVKMAKGIQWGVSTLEEVKEAYGNPTDTYEGDLYTKVTYKKDTYSTIELSIYKESGVVEDIDIENFVEPEGFDPGSISEEVPEDIAAYEAPTVLGTDLDSYTVEFDGVLYQLPCPVSELEANGWTVDKDKSAESVSAHSSEWVEIYKGGNRFTTFARNHADYATVTSNCWLEKLSAGDYGMELSMRLPLGLEIGTSEEDLKSTLEDAGIAYETEEGSAYTIYNVGEDSWNGIQFLVCADEECSLHTPKTVYKIEIAHEK